MSELSRTILAGTEQVYRAGQGLASIRAVNRERKKRAFADLGASFADAGKAFKEYGSWKAAKAAEDEIREIEGADALGRTQGDPEKRIVTLGAVRPRTRKGAEYRNDLLNKAREDWMESQRLKIAEAGSARLTNESTERTEQLARQRKALLDLAKEDDGVDPDIKSLALGEAITVDQYLRARADTRLRKKAEADAELDRLKEENRATQEAEKEAGRNRRKELDLAEKRRASEATDATRREANAIARSRLDWSKEKEENAKAIEGVWRENDALLKATALKAGAHKQDIANTLSMIDYFRKKAQADRAKLDSPEYADQRDLVLAQIEQEEASLDHWQQVFETKMAQAPEMPTLKPMPGQGGGEKPLSEQSDADLISIITGGGE